ncbi:hypothetical protein K466DRAFT_657327 [Polyporus arcularius HHB13444]|uniref:Ser-Thr-rich glycosyl-phosphatidyl-inositol-anchored membrane family-domain-containing protein n=1 Tax=Polyporus arcularius HHB13444 TaxID=1314778 RepID=A0A5C3PYS7_9APHY|nr:hypothetical protein K466DRAFT_657327 [Polyporus arcularius HHB13444]
MFAKLSVVAALALAPWAQALLLQIPVGWHSSSQVNVSWTHTDTDPVFALQLAREIFHDTFSIANNLQPAADFTSFQLGVVPAGSYTLRAINTTNVNQIYDETPAFNIDDPVSSSTTASSTSAASSSTSGSGSVSGSSTLTVSATGRSSTSGFGVTVSNTSPAATGTSNASGSSTSSSGSAAPSSFNNGAAALPRVAPLALAALGVVAGAAIVL